MKKNLVIFGLVLLLGLIAFIYKFFVAVPSPEKGLAALKIGDASFLVEVAKDDVNRIKGLSGRENLAPDQGMLFVFDTAGNYGFWMKGMKFPLDIVWVRGDQIVGFTENIPVSNASSPLVYYPPAPVDKVLELNAGSVQRYGLQIGYNINYEENASSD